MFYNTNQLLLNFIEYCAVNGMTLQVYPRAPTTSTLNFPDYSRLRISCRLYERRPLLPLLMCFSFWHLFRVLLISQGCCHRRFCQVCCRSCFSISFCCSFHACSLRTGTELFKGQRRAWVRNYFGRCYLGMIFFRRINSWRTWFFTLILANFTITSVQYCIVWGRS